MDHSNSGSTCEYRFQDTVVVVNRVFSGNRKISDLILEAISIKKHFEN